LLERLSVKDSKVKEWFVKEPYKHQIQAFKLAIQYEEFAFLMDMGTGKSACIIAACNYWGETYRATNVVIVIPKTAIDAWRNQLDIHSVLDYNFIDITQGTYEKRKAKLVSKPGMNYAVINYDSLKSFEKEFKEWAHTVVLDESHKIKNHKAIRAKVAHRLGLSVSFRLIATGTLMETPLDVWSQYHFINPRLFSGNFYKYRKEYVNYNEWTRQVSGFKDTEKLQRIIYSRGYRVTKEECLDLPDKQDIVYTFDLDVSHAKIYREMEQESITIINKSVASAAIVLTQYLRLQQITSGFVKDDKGKEIEVGDSKLDALSDVLEDGLKVVIFCRFKWEFEAISNRCKQMGRKPVVISGEVKDRSERINDFRKTDKYDTIILQINVGSTAIELFESHTVIYYSTTFGFIDYHQSRDRVHRIGQVNKVTYIHLHAKNTIDGYIYEALSSKKDVASNILSIFERMKRHES
jgi:SNF2 family DNA or RNA helicase